MSSKENFYCNETHHIHRYNGELQDDKALEKAIETGPKSVQYTGLIEWICRELKVLCKLEETVNAVTSEDDATNFLMELSSFLKELGQYIKYCLKKKTVKNKTF